MQAAPDVAKTARLNFRATHQTPALCGKRGRGQYVGAHIGIVFFEKSSLGPKNSHQGRMALAARYLARSQLDLG